LFTDNVHSRPRLGITRVTGRALFVVLNGPLEGHLPSEPHEIRAWYLAVFLAATDAESSLSTTPLRQTAVPFINAPYKSLLLLEATLSYH
jgi:hypothetical protein